jgi:glycosyltransferase involved in cell wall biosynthesis
MISELLRLGYDTEYFTFHRGEVSERIEKLGCGFMSKPEYGLIIANHNSTVREVFERGFIINTSHGILPGLEEPSVFADTYVSVSALVQETQKNRGFDSEVILNGIDCERFKPQKALNRELRTVLSLCQSDESHEFVKRCCERLSLEFLQLDKLRDNVWEIENTINKADLVMGVGRSLYDAMACGRAVISYDKRAYHKAGEEGDGYLNVGNIHQSLQKNCVGTRAFTEDEFIAELQKYRSEDGDFMRHFALENLNVRNTAQEYLRIWQEKCACVSPDILRQTKRVKLLAKQEVERASSTDNIPLRKLYKIVFKRTLKKVLGRK